MVNNLADRMRNLAAQLSVGWDDETDPDPRYVAYGQAFKEAGRRILLEVDAHEKALEIERG